MSDFDRSPQQAANGMAGGQGGPAGIGQGHIGSLTGQLGGAQEGMNRAAMGGMESGGLAELIRAIFPIFGAALGHTIAPPHGAPQPQVGGWPAAGMQPTPPIPQPFGEGTGPNTQRGFGGAPAPQPAPGMGQPRSTMPTRRQAL